ncbi:MAG TPA: Uma2 family endonuclease [Sphingomicrobium sp.]|nr:Uma2 family endonuclease [Sphingomicrobium sp.]
MARSVRRLWSLDEFLGFDNGTDTRYELFEGQIVAMAPASDVHGALVARLAVRIGAGLRPPCELVIEAGIVPPERADSWYQADLAVTCAGLTGQQYLTEPVLIVEVLSPSTATTDRERKLPDYRAIPSLQDILVVSSSEPRIEHYRREADGWKIYDLRGTGTLRLEALGISLDLHELYAGVLPAREAPGQDRTGR